MSGCEEHIEKLWRILARWWVGGGSVRFRKRKNKNIIGYHKGWKVVCAIFLVCMCSVFSLEIQLARYMQLLPNPIGRGGDARQSI
jgi:hypothetical protein